MGVGKSKLVEQATTWVTYPRKT